MISAVSGIVRRRRERMTLLRSLRYGVWMSFPRRCLGLLYPFTVYSQLSKGEVLEASRRYKNLAIPDGVLRMMIRLEGIDTELGLFLVVGKHKIFVRKYIGDGWNKVVKNRWRRSFTPDITHKDYAANIKNRRHHIFNELTNKRNEKT